MRFLTRAFVGLFLLLAVAIFLGVSVKSVKNAFEERESRGGKSRYTNERIFTSYVDTFKSVSVKPIITAYGEARSWRSLELRASNSGRLTFLSKNFREGGRVAAGEILYEIDPSETRDAYLVAEVNLKESRTELDEAKDSLTLAKENLVAAEEQVELRRVSVERQKRLSKDGVVTKTALENAEVLLSNSIQTLMSRKNSLAQVRAQINKALVKLTKSEIALDQAKRRLSDSQYKAPFDGFVSNVSAVLGRLLNKNEQLAILVDPEAIEVGFQVSNLEFSRLVDMNGNIKPLKIRVKLEEVDQELFFYGVLQRAGFEAEPGASGRQVFASLNDVKTSVIRAGDFLIVEIEEESLDKVALVPSTAIGSDGAILLVDPNNRLEAFYPTILRRQGDRIIIKDVPFGKEFVTERPPQLDAGLKVKPIRLQDKESFGLGAEKKESEPAYIDLNLTERKKLIDFLEKNGRMPDDVKRQMIDNLSKEKVSLKLIERLRKRMGDN